MTCFSNDSENEMLALVKDKLHLCWNYNSEGKKYENHGKSWVL